MRKNLLTIVVLSISLSLWAQPCKRGFKSLEKVDYLKAKEVFEKNLTDNADDIASNFGYALVLADEKSGYFDIIASWKYASIVVGNENKLTQDELDIIGEYFMNTEVRRTSRPVKQKIEIAIQAIEDRLIKFIREENNLEAVYRVLNEYPDFKYYDNVVHIRNQFEYRKYEKMNTLQGYQDFINNFEGAAQIPKAILKIEKLAFEDAKRSNTIEAFSHYIEAYPESELVPSAIKLRNAAAFSKAKADNTIEAYDAFIRQYPSALEIAQAMTIRQDLVYQQAKRVQSLEAYNDFIRQYPEGKYFVDIFNLKSKEIGNTAWWASGLPGTKLSWARGFDNNQRVESAAGISFLTDGSYVVVSSTQVDSLGNTDAWVICINPEGTMLWNKFVGQDYRDSVIGVLTTQSDDIIVLGYTQVFENDSTMLGWMFKLDANGKRIWNKSLGLTEILAFDIDKQDRILLSTRHRDAPDSVAAPYRLQSFNTDGNMVWERSYVSLGNFIDIAVSTNGNTMLTGTDWLVLLDEKRYIIWDAFLPEPITAQKGTFVNDVKAVVASKGLNDLNYTAYSSSTPEWSVKVPLNDSTHKVSNLSVFPLQDEIIGAELDNMGAFLRRFSSSGVAKGNFQLNPDYIIRQILPNPATGSLLILAESKGDVLLFSLTGL